MSHPPLYHTYTIIRQLVVARIVPILDKEQLKGVEL